MTIQTRRAIYIIFIVIFLIVTPIILFYTAGYRYDFKKNKMLKTGGIFLLVKEPQSQIYLNGKLEKESGIIFNNEIRFNNLLPNNYHLAVKKDGYYPWEKTLPVYSQQTTFAEHISMFLKKEAEQINSAPNQILSLSPDQKYFIYLELNKGVAEILIMDTGRWERELLYRADYSFLQNLEPREIAGWSMDSKKILINVSNKEQDKISLVVDLDKNGESILLNDFIDIKLDKIYWGTNNSNILYGNSQNIIYEINLLDKSIAPTVESAKDNIITDFYRDNDNFWYLAKNKNETLLFKKNIWSGEEIVLKLEQDDYYFIPSAPSKIFSLYNKTEQRVILVEKDTLNKLLDEYAAAAQWNNKGSRLLYYNDFELWHYNLTENKKELISRYSQEIKKALWVPGVDYVIFLLGDNLKIIELDDRDQRNFYHLTENAGLNNFIINGKGQWVYFSSAENENPGLYKLQIR